jgi:conjugal transfer pilus assembly protein TraK
MKTFSMLFASVLSTLISPALFAEDDMPVVPVSVMRDGVPAPINSTPSLSVNEKANIVMKPGVNEIIPIAISHLNRIVTPFSTPEVNTTASATTKIKDNVVYVATDSEVPVTMFINEKGSQALAVSITMVPRKIPPREVFLSMKDSAETLTTMMLGNKKAEQWETSQPYIDTIKTAFKEIALGQTPQGYTLSKIPQNADIPSCQQPGLIFDFRHGQLIAGHNLTIYIGTITNTTNQPLEFKERSCGNWNVAGVTSWPINVLESGQKTEVYVALKAMMGSQSPASRRPSLIN